MTDPEQIDQQEVEQQEEKSSSLSPSRRGVLAGTAAGLGLAGLGSARGDDEHEEDDDEHEEDDNNGQGRGPPWNQECKNDEDWWCSQGHQLSPRRLADTDTYDNEPNITRLDNNDLLLIYRRASTDGGGHVNNTGRIVAQISEDWGESWSDVIEVANDSDYDTRNQSIIYDRDSGVVSVHYRLYDAGGGGQIKELYKFSEDNGRSWSNPQQVPIEYINTNRTLAPFGGYTRTSNGLMTEWYGFDSEGNYGVVEALFSTDGGRTWGDNVLVGDSTNVSGRVLTEPVPAAYTEDKIWTFGRDNETADMFAIQSEDGGRTWGEPIYFNPTGMKDPTPAWFKRTNANEVTVIWGDRTNNRVSEVNVSARLAWQDPTAIEEQEVTHLAEQMSENEADFGYVTFSMLGRDERHTLVTFYDEDSAPNIWLMSLGGEGLSAAETSNPPIEANGAKIRFGRAEGIELPPASDDGWDTRTIKRIQIEFETEFDSRPSVNTTIANAATGLVSYTSDVTTSGFTLQVINHRTSRRPALVDWIAAGQ